MSFAVTAVVASSVGTALSYVGSRKAEKAAKRQGRAEAEIEQEVTAESLRQLRRRERLLSEQTIARTAGQGIRVDSVSPLAVMADQAREFARERRITEEVGASRAETSLQRADTLANQIRFQGYSSLFSGIASSYTMGRDFGLWGK